MTAKTPLFPLNALVCPGGKLPLRVFEVRYLDMVKQSLKQGVGFVIVMLREGQSELANVSDPVSRFYQIGTLVNIIDFDQGEDGVLNITVQGGERVRLSHAEQNAQGLWLADTEALDEESFVALPEEFLELKSVLQALVQHPVVRDLNVEIDYQDGRQIGWRLTELLPLDNADKQCLLELNDPVYRLEKISDRLDQMIA